MTNIKVGILAAILVIAAFIGVGYLLPSGAKVERSIVIAAEPDVIFPYLNSLKQFHQWSTLNPNMAVTYEGPESGEGARMRWSSEDPNLGEGEQTIVRSVPGERVDTVLTFGGEGRAESYFQLVPNGEETQVTWGFSTDYGENIISRYMGLMVDDSIASEFQQGLSNLKELVETAPLIQTRTVDYTVNGTVMTGYLARPLNVVQAPGVLVVHEWWGHNDYARQRAEMLAELGYVAFALDMYGDGKVTDHPKEANAFMTEVLSNAEVAQARFDTAYKLLQDLPITDPERIAAIGYCFGGSVVLSMARAGAPLKGVVSFHGGLQGLAPIAEGEVEARFLVLNGADDPMVSEEHITQFKQEMDEAELPYKFVNYPGALHSFTNPEADAIAEAYDLPVAYDPEADADSWQRMEEFLRKTFNGLEMHTLDGINGPVSEH